MQYWQGAVSAVLGSAETRVPPSWPYRPLPALGFGGRWSKVLVGIRAAATGTGAAPTKAGDHGAPPNGEAMILAVPASAEVR